MRVLYWLLLGLTMASGVAAQSPTIPSAKRGVINSDFNAAAALVEDYFNTLTTLQASFTQTQTDRPGEVARGTFSLNRPQGQFLWQYATPVRQRIIGTGTAVYYIDQSATHGANQVTQLPLDAGLGRLLHGGELSLRKVGLRVNGLQQTDQLSTISLATLPSKADNQGLRRLTLAFTNAPVNPTLVSFSATDVLGVTTQVRLSNIVTGVQFPRGFFNFTPPQYRER
jgi:outer membrane lipoprotein-sorting protein